MKNKLAAESSMLADNKLGKQMFLNLFYESGFEFINQKSMGNVQESLEKKFKF